MTHEDDVELIAEAIKHAQLPEPDPWDIARTVLGELAAAGRLSTRLPEHLRGDGPCKDCGNEDNIRWFTESVFWNHVIGGPGTMGDPGGIVCVPCFVKCAAVAGYHVEAWRLLPEWHWETVAERGDRRAREFPAVTAETPATKAVDHE